VVAAAIAPPTISKSFGTTVSIPGGTAALSFTIGNPNPTVALTGVGFTDTLPAGLAVATPNGLTGSCGGGLITATAGSGIVSLTGATLAPGVSCTFSVNVAVTSGGVLINITGNVISSNGGLGNTASAQIVVGSSFQKSYAANYAVSDSIINIINTGAHGASALGPGLGGAVGNTCVNVYAVDPSEELVACCSCLLTPNQVVNLGVNTDLLVKTQTGVVPPSVTIALVNTLAGPTGAGTSCTNSATAAGGTNFPIADGMAAYDATPQAIGAVYNVVEHPFAPSTLSTGELASLTGRCSSIVGNASGYGICLSCRSGALGAIKQ
jgi:hypothetical protein